MKSNAVLAGYGQQQLWRSYSQHYSLEQVGVLRSVDSIMLQTYSMRIFVETSRVLEAYGPVEILEAHSTRMVLCMMR